MYKGDEHMEKALAVVCQKVLLCVDKHWIFFLHMQSFFCLLTQ